MSDIRSSLSLTDRFTPTLRSVLKAMDSTLRVMKDLDRASNKGVQSKAYKQAEKDIQRANNALKKMGNYTQLANKAARDGEKAYSRMGSAVSRVGTGMNSVARSSSMFLQSLASGVYLAQRLANAVGNIMNSADTGRSQAARLSLFNTSDFTNQQLYGSVFRTAMNTRSGLTETADLANKLLIADVFSEQSDPLASIATAGLINKALVAGGASHEENQRALRQLTQGLASGQLQGDELRSIREQTPKFAQLLAQGLGRVDSQFEGIGIGDLKRLGAEGELTSERIVKAMWAMQDEINKDFETMPKTFGQAMTSLNNIWEYFLYLISGTDGPLGKINAKIWQFVQYLQSPAGVQLLEDVASGLDVVSTAIAGALQGVGDFVTFLQDNAPIAESLFAGIGAAAVAAGVKAAIAWVAACWPILLIIALVGVLTYALISAGFTIQEIVGGVAGFILGLLAGIWNVILTIGQIALGLVTGIVSAIIAIGTAVILAVQGVVQVITWVVMAVITAFWAIYTAGKTVGLLIKAAFSASFIAIASIFYGIAQVALGALELIAKGIDAVFGSDLAKSVQGWSGSLEGQYTAFVEEHDPTKSTDQIKLEWEKFGLGVKDMFTNDKYNLYDEMGNLVNGASGLINDIDAFNQTGQDFLEDKKFNLEDAFNTGKDWGEGLFKNTELKLPDDSVLDKFNPDEITIKGGYLDSIKSDVTINEEDLKLLRDMTARDYLLQLQTITPVANVKFGDVRETADVNRIVEVIEDMVEQQMATSLVG